MKYETLPVGATLQPGDQIRAAGIGRWVNCDATIGLTFDPEDVGIYEYRRPVKDEPKKPNPESLRRAIQDLPICAEGKSKVTKLVEEITGTKLKPEPTYNTGQRFLVNGQEHILAQVGQRIISLINLKNGNRWTDGVKVSDISNITREELTRALGTLGGDITPIS